MNVSVKYSGPWAEASGYAQANRNIIQAIYEAGVDLVTELQQYSDYKTDYGAQYNLAKSLEGKHKNYKVKVLHIIPSVYPKYKEVGKYHVGHLFWETSGMSKQWSWYLKEIDEIWTHQIKRSKDKDNKILETVSRKELRHFVLERTF